MHLQKDSLLRTAEDDIRIHTFAFEVFLQPKTQSETARTWVSDTLPLRSSGNRMFGTHQPN